MNKARMRILADVLNGAGLPMNFKFKMDTFHEDGDAIPGQSDPFKCSTAGCVAGLASFMFGSRDSSVNIDSEARKLLGLTKTEAKNLFYINGPGVPDGVDLTKIKKAHAAKVVAHAAKTGKIDWRKAGKLPVEK